MNAAELDGFYDAARARQIAMGHSAGTNTVLVEINTIKEAVNTAASGGDLEATITAATAMTNSEDYFRAWNDPFNYDSSADKLRRLEMTQVINFFSRLGYTVKRSRVDVTERFEWIIRW